MENIFRLIKEVGSGVKVIHKKNNIKQVRVSRHSRLRIVKELMVVVIL